MEARRWNLFISSSSRVTLFKSQQHQRVVCKTLRKRHWSDSGPNEISCAKSEIIVGGEIFWRFLLIPTLGRVSRRKVEKTKFCEKHRFGENIMSAAISFSQAVLDFYFASAQKRINLNAAKSILIHVYVKKIVGVCIAFISETQSFRATLTQFLSEWKSLWWR